MDETLFSFQKKYMDLINFGFSHNISVVVSGKSGSGKTFMCDSFIRSQEDFNVLHCVFSNSSISTIDHREIKLAIFDYVSARERTGLSKDTVKKISEASKDIPYIGNTINSILDILVNRRVSNFDFETIKLFTEDECEIINYLTKLTKEKPLIIFFDNAHWMSTHTFNFVSNLIRTFHKISKNDVHYLFALTSDQEANLDVIFDNNHKIVKINDICEEEYKEVVERFTLTKYSYNNDINAMLFAITGGHLELTKNLLSIIGPDRNGSKLNLIEQYQESAANKEEIIDSFLRLFNITLAQYIKDNKYADETIETLEIASIIGNVFNKYDLSELTKIDYPTLVRYMQNPCFKQFAIDEEKTAKFIHPLIRDLFFRRLDNQQRKWHKKYAECLRILRPTETMLIGFHYQYAFEHKNAMKYYVVGYMKCITLGIEIPSKTYRYIHTTLSELQWSEFFTSLKTAIELYKQNELAKSIKVLEELEPIDIPTEFFSHYRDLLYSEILIQYDFRTERFKKAAHSLEEALKYFTDTKEIELSINVLLLLMNLYADKLNDTQRAKYAEQHFLRLYQNYNQNGNLEQYYYEYKRKSSTLYSPEITLKRIKECSDFHSSNRYSTIEYYKCLCNYSGSLIFMGLYPEAIEILNSCAKMMKDTISIGFPEPHKFVNNYILANYLHALFNTGDKVNMTDFITAYENYSKESGLNYGTKILNINKANLYYLYGKHEEAKQILFDIAQYLEENKDAFYHIYVYSNLASIFYVEKRYDLSNEYLSIVENHIPQLMPNMKPYFEERVKLFRQLVASEVELNATDLLMYFLKKYPDRLGKSWNFVGLGFLFSDMQFYTT
jgi:tetratricopeptide (TPR) repeat protein